MYGVKEMGEEKGKLTDAELIAYNYGFCMARWQEVGGSLPEHRIENGGLLMTQICNVMCERLGIQLDKDYVDLIHGLQDLQVSNLFKRSMEQLQEERKEKQ